MWKSSKRRTTGITDLRCTMSKTIVQRMCSCCHAHSMTFRMVWLSKQTMRSSQWLWTHKANLLWLSSQGNQEACTSSHIMAFRPESTACINIRLAKMNSLRILILLYTMIGIACTMIWIPTHHTSWRRNLIPARFQKILTLLRLREPHQRSKMLGSQSKNQKSWNLQKIRRLLLRLPTRKPRWESFRILKVQNKKNMTLNSIKFHTIYGTKWRIWSILSLRREWKLTWMISKKSASMNWRTKSKPTKSTLLTTLLNKTNRILMIL